jgi:hypothetical protein
VRDTPSSERRPSAPAVRPDSPTRAHQGPTTRTGSAG